VGISRSEEGERRGQVRGEYDQHISYACVKIK
jgi:hypothetical protein